MVEINIALSITLYLDLIGWFSRILVIEPKKREETGKEIPGIFPKEASE
jgi:hypothetical protein